MYAKKPNIQLPICTVGLYVSLCLMIFLCLYLHCKALRTAMYRRYINAIIIIIFGRLPHKIASNYGGYTTSQWKKLDAHIFLVLFKRSASRETHNLLADINFCSCLQVDMFSNHIQDWYCQSWSAFCKIWPKVWTVVWKEVCHP